MKFSEWLEKHFACEDAQEWVLLQADQSIPALLKNCPRGDWILWCYEEAGYQLETLAPVAYRAVNRALGYAAYALDRAGIQHDLRSHNVADRKTARKAADAAAAYGADAYDVAADAYAYAAADAAADGDGGDAYDVAAAAADAADAAADAYAAEHRQCADDCRELLPELVIEGVE